MRRHAVVCLLAGCGGAAEVGSVRATASMVLAEQTGQGPSSLDVLLGQSIGFEVELADAIVTHDTVEACRWTVHTTEMPVATATGANAALVQTDILDRLPAWDLTLSVCAVATQSSVTLHADFPGMAVIAGCLAIPDSAQVTDEQGDPRWTSFTGMRCQASVYDQSHGRLFTASNVTMQFATTPR
jgi:hypothetical protein